MFGWESVCLTGSPCASVGGSQGVCVPYWVYVSDWEGICVWLGVCKSLTSGLAESTKLLMCFQASVSLQVLPVSDWISALYSSYNKFTYVEFVSQDFCFLKKKKDGSQMVSRNSLPKRFISIYAWLTSLSHPDDVPWITFTFYTSVIFTVSTKEFKMFFYILTLTCL